uniref:Uncharacterized protein n=1 Tax=Caenorhabditis tropicalis TaxID=1561998 RepID=A0A1I7TBY8_9PELO
MVRSLFILALIVALVSIEAAPLRENLFSSQEDADVVVDFGGFHLVNVDRVLDAEPLDKALLRFGHLRALPIMKRSIAIGRAGFRPGKRSVDLFDF